MDDLGWWHFVLWICGFCAAEDMKENHILYKLKKNPETEKLIEMVRRIKLLFLDWFAKDGEHNVFSFSAMKNASEKLDRYELPRHLHNM